MSASQISSLEVAPTEQGLCTPSVSLPAAAVAASCAAADGGECTLPIDIPRSDTLWLFLTNGYSYSEISSWPDVQPHGQPDKTLLLQRAAALWLQIRGEAAAWKPASSSVQAGC